LLAVCSLLLLLFSRRGAAFLAEIGLRKPATGSTLERAPILYFAGALLVLALAAIAVLGSKNDFEWVEPSGSAWALKHTVRGTVARFSADAIASIEGREEAIEGEVAYRIRFAFRNGQERTVSTSSPSAFREMKQLAAALELPAGRMRLTPASGEAWTNGGFTLKSCTGRYTAASGDVIELRLDPAGRLTGIESSSGGSGGKARQLRAVKVAEDGSLEYRTGFLSSGAGRFEAGALVIGGTTFTKNGE
jgi:hypothetical protein